MTKRRKAVSSRTRFEVFKRDAFTCQYCGSQAPDVILHLDHVIAVANGGDNDITNLVTACSACNGGKSDVPLCDNSAVKKQKRQLDELNERRQQIEMIVQWRKELRAINDMAACSVIDHFEACFGVKLLEHGRQKIVKAVKSFGVSEALDAVDKAVQAYSDANRAVEKLSGICTVSRREKTDPAYGIVSRIFGSLKTRGFYTSFSTVDSLVRNAVEAGATVDQLRKVVSAAKCWTDWRSRMVEQSFLPDSAQSPVVTD